VNNIKNSKKKRYSPYWKKGNKMTNASRKPLANNFISGGYATYA
jgi:hypothetical protein